MAAKRSQRTHWRPLHGILLLDKPAGMSSNAALQQVRRLLRAEKGGHTGSLDPLATGLLPLCFGEATKIAGLLLGADKAYEVEACLGVCTDTLDADGVVLSTRPLPSVDGATLDLLLQSFCGEQMQVPPAYSALKQDGVPAYQRARAGEVVELAARAVHIAAIERLDFAGSRLRLRVRCGTGTYIRSLIRDLGEALGCGAHVTALRRLWVVPFSAPVMHTLDALQNMDEPARLRCLLPIEAGLSAQPALQLDADQAARLRQGQRLPSTQPAGHYIGWFEGRALGRFRVDPNGLICPDRLFNPASESAADEH